MEKIKQNPFVKKVGFNRIVLCFVLLLMYAFFCALTQGSFFGIERILSTLNYAYFLGFLSLGVTFVIATGGIDFSIGPVMFCCALISGYCFTSHGMPMPVALILSIVIGLIFGIFNGYLVAYWSVPSFITSMASMNISKGVASVFTKTQSVSWPQEMQDGGWFRKIISIDGIPVGLIIFLAVAIVCAILLNKTKLGRYILCHGYATDDCSTDRLQLKSCSTTRLNCCKDCRVGNCCQSCKESTDHICHDVVKFNINS